MDVVPWPWEMALKRHDEFRDDAPYADENTQARGEVLVEDIQGQSSHKQQGGRLGQAEACDEEESRRIFRLAQTRLEKVLPMIQDQSSLTCSMRRVSLALKASRGTSNWRVIPTDVVMDWAMAKSCRTS